MRSQQTSTRRGRRIRPWHVMESHYWLPIEFPGDRRRSEKGFEVGSHSVPVRRSLYRGQTVVEIFLADRRARTTRKVHLARTRILRGVTFVFHHRLELAGRWHRPPALRDAR